ncbi:MAG: ATP-dependent Clp protease ATP-binding subunit ClpA, partial [Alphaproteobacteria bacterium]
QLEGQLSDRGVTIELSDEARDWLAKKGYDKLYGARPLQRIIQEHIKKRLADELLFGELVDGGHVKVVVEDKKLGFDIDTSMVEKKPDPEDGGDGDGDKKVTEPVDS